MAARRERNLPPTFGLRQPHRQRLAALRVENHQPVGAGCNRCVDPPRRQVRTRSPASTSTGALVIQTVRRLAPRWEAFPRGGRLQQEPRCAAVSTRWDLGRRSSNTRLRMLVVFPAAASIAGNHRPGDSANARRCTKSSRAGSVPNETMSGSASSPTPRQRPDPKPQRRTCRMTSMACRGCTVRPRYPCQAFGPPADRSQPWSWRPPAESCEGRRNDPGEDVVHLRVFSDASSRTNCTARRSTLVTSSPER